MQKRLFFFLFSLLLLMPAHKVAAQFDTLQIFEGGISDGRLLLNAYIRPWLDAFAQDLNGGWYNTARPHEMGGVDVMLTANLTIVPNDARTFDLKGLPFDTLQVSGPSGIAPTVAGTPEEGPELIYREYYNGDTITVAQFNTQPGTGLHNISIPFLQVGIGLPGGTDIIGRFLIPVDVPKSNARMSLVGIGVKHDLKQWMPGLKDVPVGVAVFGGYTYFQIYSGFKEEPDNYDYMEDYLPAHYTGQEVRSVMQSFSFDFLLSTDFNLVNGFGGLGYERSWVKTEVNGNIPVPVFDPEISAEEAVYTDDHVYHVPDTKFNLHSKFRINAGVRLNISLFTFYLAYKWTGSSVYTAGLGISFR